MPKGNLSEHAWSLNTYVSLNREGPVNAAIYVRKSTLQAGMSEECRSVERQKARALEYAANKGWTVSPEHIFEDDGISGAEFERRPGFQRLKETLRVRSPFRYLIVMEESRL